MKLKIILILFLILPIYSNSQIYIDSINNNEVKFKQLYNVDLKKDKIRKLVNKWIAVNFNDANTVIKLDNEDNTILKGTFIVSTPADNVSLKSLIDYTLDVSYKDNKYKIEFYDLIRYYEIMKDTKKTVDPNTETFEHYNKIRSHKSREENQINYDKALKYREAENSQITSYLVNISKTLNEYINKNTKANDW